MTLGLDPEHPLPFRPPVLLIHLLNRCNLRCEHCYLEAGCLLEDRLPARWVRRCLEDAGTLGISRVFLSGGEPLLYPELRAVLERGRELDLELFVCTNGTLIGRTEAEMLAAHGVEAQVSLDGQEAYHDRFRGVEGAWRRTARGVAALVAAGVPVAVVTTITRENLSTLPWIAQWALDAGARRVSVLPLLRFGRGAEIRDQQLGDEEVCDLFIRLSELGHAYRAKGLTFSMAHRRRAFLEAHPCAAYVCNGAGCHRKVEKEIKKLVVREDGTVLPEIATLDPRFALGTLRDGRLPELVDRYFENGYERFDRLCRTVYREVMTTGDSPLVAWNEIVSERSRTLDLEAAPPDGLAAWAAAPTSTPS